MFIPVIDIFLDDKVESGIMAKYFRKNDLMKPLKGHQLSDTLLGAVYLLAKGQKNLRKGKKHRLVLLEEDQVSFFAESEKKNHQGFDAIFKTTELESLESYLRNYNEELTESRKSEVLLALEKSHKSFVSKYEKAFDRVQKKNFSWKSKNAAKLFDELEYLISKREFLGEERINWKDVYQILHKSKVFKSITYDEVGLLLGVKLSEASLLCLTKSEKQWWCAFEFLESVGEIEQDLILGHLLSYYDDFFRPLPVVIKELKILTDAFSFFPNALCVVDEKGDLIFHNAEFIKLGISPVECLKQNSGDKVEVLHDSNHFYILEKNQLPLISTDREKQYTLLTIKTFEKTNEINLKSHDQLGIITSSLAHELNNPLGGLLAMVNLLELEDEFIQDGEAKKSLEEIKSGTLKCKTMVDLLLGFSKSELQEKIGPFIKESLDQALSLLNSRMIESNVKINLTIENEHEFKSFNVRAPVLSMIYYMIFGQLVTEFARLRLIRDSTESVLNVTVKLNRTLHKVELLLSESLDLRSFFLHSTLLGHLLLLEKNTLEVLPRSIKFKYNEQDN